MPDSTDAALAFERVIVGYGTPIEDGARTAFDDAVAWLAPRPQGSPRQHPT